MLCLVTYRWRAYKVPASDSEPRALRVVADKETARSLLLCFDDRKLNAGASHFSPLDHVCLLSKVENPGHYVGNDGGAIFNAGKTSFTQDATFEYNKAEVSND